MERFQKPGKFARPSGRRNASFWRSCENLPFRTRREIETALQPFAYAAHSARNKRAGFAAATATENGKPSRRGEISTRNKKGGFVAGEATENGKPSRRGEISTRNKRAGFAAGEGTEI